MCVRIEVLPEHIEELVDATLANSTFGVDEGAIGAVVAGSRGGSMRANPIELTDDELAGILAAALASG